MDHTANVMEIHLLIMLNYQKKSFHVQMNWMKIQNLKILINFYFLPQLLIFLNFTSNKIIYCKKNYIYLCEHGFIKLKNF